ncbi:MAG: hypothetical protein JWO94_1226 [Verrucomicrobiaceae bacterium]|nr:hypothetical protein [Verrucomicrobiaceae bacterium]
MANPVFLGEDRAFFIQDLVKIRSYSFAGTASFSFGLKVLWI